MVNGEADDVPNEQVLCLRVRFDVTDEAALRHVAARLFGSDAASRVRHPVAMVVARTASQAISELPGITMRGLSADWEDVVGNEDDSRE